MRHLNRLSPTLSFFPLLFAATLNAQAATDAKVGDYVRRIAVADSLQHEFWIAGPLDQVRFVLGVVGWLPDTLPLSFDSVRARMHSAIDAGRAAVQVIDATAAPDGLTRIHAELLATLRAETERAKTLSIAASGCDLFARHANDLRNNAARKRSQWTNCAGPFTSALDSVVQGDTEYRAVRGRIESRLKAAGIELPEFPAIPARLWAKGTAPR